MTAVRTTLQTFEPGVIILGRYRVEKVVGRGGMGVVLAAWDSELQHRVAIKILVGMALAESEPVERFMREARIVVKLTSDHVVRVINAGTLESGAPYIVMDLLEGHDLGDHEPVPPATAVDYMLQAIDAVAEAHAQNVIHRDLKPSNLFLAMRSGASPIIKVLDFGISKASQLEGDPSLTGTTSIMGSPRYMSPEQFRSAKLVDERTDVWALGAIGYQLLAGTPPFDGAAMTEVFEAVMHREPPPIRVLRPEVPVGLEQVIFRCLRKNASDRFMSVAELAQALSPFGTGEWQRCVVRANRLLADTSTLNVQAGSVVPPPLLRKDSAIPPPPTQIAPERSWEGVDRNAPATAAVAPTRRRWWIAGAIVAALVLLVTTTALGVWIGITWMKQQLPQAALPPRDSIEKTTITPPPISPPTPSSNVAMDAGTSTQDVADASISTISTSSSARSPDKPAPSPSTPKGRPPLTEFQRSRLLGHYSTLDGRSGFVLDRLGDPWKARLDGETGVKNLKSQGGPRGTIEYVAENESHEFWIRVQKDSGEILYFDGPKEVEGVKVVRDEDARPLR